MVHMSNDACIRDEDKTFVLQLFGKPNCMEQFAGVQSQVAEVYSTVNFSVARKEKLPGHGSLSDPSATGATL